MTTVTDIVARVETAGTHVLTLTEGLEVEDLRRSRLTRQETHRQLLLLTQALSELPHRTRERMTEMDWDGWAHIVQQLGATPEQQQDVLWFAVRSLTPATLMWLRFYRERHPELFAA